MSDPRATITRTVIGPTPPMIEGASPRPQQGPAPTAAGRLIGKRHGNMRSVGLTLSRTAADEIYRLAKSEDITLGEVLVLAAQRSLSSSLPAGSAGPVATEAVRARGPRMRRGLDTRTVYVLLTPDEARWISQLAAERNCTVSDLATRCITTTTPA